MDIRTFLKKTQAVLLALILVYPSSSVSYVEAESIEGIEATMENPAYSYYQNHKEEFVHGYIPPKILFPVSTERSNPVVKSFRSSGSTVPSRYDAREDGLVTKVKDQNPTEACWAYAATAAVETSFRKKGENHEFSEMHVAYNNMKNKSLNSGGNAVQAMAYYARLDGPVFENKYPTAQEAQGETLPGHTLLEDFGAKKADKYVGDMIVISKEEIKKYVLRHGGVFASYYADPNPTSTNYTKMPFESEGEELGYHVPFGDATQTNHGVLIVGWDDNKKIKTLSGSEATGAYLVKNSWGEMFGDNGYLWISYDTFSKKPTITQYYVFANVGEKKENIYQFDKTETGMNIKYKKKQFYIANEYKRKNPAQKEKVTDIAFYNINPGTIEYKVWITEKENWKDEDATFYGSNDGNLAGTLIAEGTLDHSGYYTIPALQEFELTKDKFVLKMKIKRLDSDFDSIKLLFTPNNLIAEENKEDKSYQISYGFQEVNEWKYSLNALTKNVESTEEVFDVTFDVQGGNPKPEKQSIVKGQKATKPQDPQKEGYAFAGWKLEGKEFDFNNVPIEKAITLIAEWKQLHNLSIGAMTNGSVTIEGGKTKAAAGETITLIPSPSAGYHFTSWDVKDRDGGKITVTAGNTFVMPSKDVGIKAVFEKNAPVEYNLSIGAMTNGSVTIEGGKTKAAAGETITLIPSAAAGYHFTSWDVKDSDGGKITVTGSNTFVMPSKDVGIKAIFEKNAPVEYNLSIGAMTNGSVTIEGGKTKAAAGETITLIPSPSAGYHFTSWDVKDRDGGKITVTAGNTFVMPSKDVGIKAVFEKNAPVEYNLSIGAMTNGSVTIEGGKTKAAAGETITLIPSAAAGYHFISWDVKDSDGGKVTATGNTFVMPAKNVVIKAEFEKNAPVEYNLSIGAMTNGSVTIEGGKTKAAAGETITLIPSAAAGYHFISWDVKDSDGGKVTATGNTFVMPAKNVVIKAEFEKNAPVEYNLNMGAMSNGSVTIQGGKTKAAAGETITLIPSANPGYHFKTWDIKDSDGGKVTATGNTFVMPAKNVVIKAEFEKNAPEPEEPNKEDQAIIDTQEVEVLQGENKTFVITSNAEVLKEIKWSISGNDKMGTFITEEGVLTVATDETSLELTVKAELKNGKILIAKVIVKQKEKPQEPNKPQEPSNPQEPNKPQEPSNPQEPNKPQEPSNPQEPNKPQEPSNPQEPNKPEPPRAEVNAVVVNPNSVWMKQGERRSFRAEVFGTGDYDRTVMWVLEGNSSFDTVMESGLLSIGNLEQAERLIVKAVSVQDPNIVGEAVINVLKRVEESSSKESNNEDDHRWERKEREDRKEREEIRNQSSSGGGTNEIQKTKPTEELNKKPITELPGISVKKVVEKKEEFHVPTDFQEQKQVIKEKQLVEPRKISFSLHSNVMKRDNNGEEKSVKMDSKPFVEKGRVMIPVRYVSQALGMKVNWDKKASRVVLTNGKRKVEIPLNSNQIIVDGKVYLSDVKPSSKDGRIYLTISNLAKALGLEMGKDIVWDNQKKEMSIQRQ